MKKELSIVLSSHILYWTTLLKQNQTGFKYFIYYLIERQNTH